MSPTVTYLPAKRHLQDSTTRPFTQNINPTTNEEHHNDGKQNNENKKINYIFSLYVSDSDESNWL